MSNVLNVAIIQTSLVWENPEDNRRLLKDKINVIPDDVDLIILPEMFTSGFTMHPAKVAETMDGKTITWLKQMAANKNAAIIGSLVIKENNHFYNRLVCIDSFGNITKYDKRHTFTLVGEDKVYTAGSEKVIFNYKGWKICPLVCYDLRFPVWSRNTEDYDVLLYVANWPQSRINAWDALLKARAIENMCYCIGVNRIGKDEKNNIYCGHSAAYDVFGNLMHELQPNKDYIEYVVLDQAHITRYRNKLKFLDDKDAFTLM